MAYGQSQSQKGGLLGGLSANPSVAAFGKGRTMSGAAGVGMERQKNSQELAVNQMQQDSQQRMQQAGNYAARAGNETQERIQAGGLANRMALFHTNMGFEQEGANRQRALNFRQALFNSLTKDF